MSHRPLSSRLREATTRSFFLGIAAAARLHPQAKPARHGVTVTRDVPYLPSGALDHTLDIYAPTHRPGPWPVVFYVHGGGFRMLSKDTHWVMGLSYARAGYLTVVMNYRLVPAAPYPAALDDVCAAYRWLAAHVERLGGDPARVALAGESAGGNLALALALVMARRWDAHPFTATTHAAGLRPRALMPYCGLLQVSDPERFQRRRTLPPLVWGTVRDTARGYTQGTAAGVDVALADPLLVVESDVALPDGLPPTFTTVGTRDPLLDDTRRLHAALVRRGVPSETRYYPGGVHAFHAFVWQAAARRCWRDSLAFLDAALRPDGPAVRTHAVTG